MFSMRMEITVLKIVLCFGTCGTIWQSENVSYFTFMQFKVSLHYAHFKDHEEITTCTEF